MRPLLDSGCSVIVFEVMPFSKQKSVTSKTPFSIPYFVLPCEPITV